jgi:biopolymer transport protein ExbD
MALRGGKRRARQRGEATIDVSSFSDIAFLLIIFFILTTTFVKTAGQKLEIPSGSSDRSAKKEKQLTVNLSSTDIRWGEKAEQVSLDELRGILMNQGFKEKKPGDRIVILDAAPDVAYERYFQVVSAIAAADGVMALLED